MFNSYLVGTITCGTLPPTPSLNCILTFFSGIDANSFAKLGLNPDVYDSIVRIQVFYRGYRTIQRFKSIVNECVMRIRTERRRLAEIQQDQEALTHFRELLARGFPALKLTSHGKWKTASFRLILKSNECYLTWEPSRKLHPRLNLHDIERVEPIRRGDHDEIASFISHRKCLLIFSKTLREGSMILQLSTARERELLLKGFESLIQQIKTSRSQLDESGVVRQQAHQKAVVFFQQGENPQEQERQNPLETLYHTRFDHDAIELQEETSEEHDLDELFNRKFKQIS